MTALLTAIALLSLFAGRLAPIPLAASCLLPAALFLLPAGRHRHGGGPVMDACARRSRLSRENAGVKAAGSLLLLVLCICSGSPWPPLLLFCFLSGVTLLWGKTRPHDYLSLLTLPAVFLLLSALTLLWDFFPERPAGAALSVPFFGGWLAVLPASQELAGLVLARAVGAVGCLYFLSLSTPLPELLHAARRAHVPAVVTSLAVLIYRYLFLLLDAARTRRDAADSRLGYRGLRRSLRTTGLVYGNLLAHGFRRAGACYDAMESRCFTGEIAFLTRPKPVTARLLLLLLPAVAAMLAGVLLVR